MSKPSFHVIPKGEGYIIERRKGGERHTLTVRGDDFKFHSRFNADRYADLLEKDEPLVRNDQWMPVVTRYQGGAGVSRIGMR